MRILIKILDIASNNAFNINVKEIRVGLGYIAVLLDDNRVVLAYTIRKDFLEGCSVFHCSLPLAGKNALELLNFLKSDQSIKQLGLQQPMPL